MPFNKDNKPFFKKRFVVGPRLNQEDFSKAKKESLCFICLSPDHSQWNCPKNKRRRDDEKGKGPDKNHKDRQLHVAQILPISGNEKYKFIEVLHTDKEHYCCLSTSMWKSSFGPHELVRMHGFVNGKRVRVMIDDSATHNFVNYALVKKLKLSQHIQFGTRGTRVQRNA